MKKVMLKRDREKLHEYFMLLRDVRDYEYILKDTIKWGLRRGELKTCAQGLPTDELHLAGNYFTLSKTIDLLNAVEKHLLNDLRDIMKRVIVYQ